jgi:hypothetical protein
MGYGSRFERLTSPGELQRWLSLSPVKLPKVRIRLDDLHRAKALRGAIWRIANAVLERGIPGAGDVRLMNAMGIRSFDEQIKHIACGQFAFFNEFEGKKPPNDCEKGGHDPARTKSELMMYPKSSFDYGNRVLATLTPNNALDRIEGRYAGPNTKLGISVVAVWHLTDHYGQLVEYLRMNGIVPPQTQKYGSKVR